MMGAGGYSASNTETDMSSVSAALRSVFTYGGAFNVGRGTQTATATATSSEGGPGMNPWLIGGIAAGVLLVVFLLFRK